MPDIGQTISFKNTLRKIGGGDTGEILCRVCMTLMLFASLLAAPTVKVISTAEETGKGSASEESPDLRNQEDARENYVISVDVNLVTADVTVIGNNVSPLRVEDFTIYDNGVSQKIDYFSHDLLPLAVAVLVDTSGSVAPYFPMLKLAALISLRHLRPEDQVALFSFSSSLKKLSDLTEDRLLIAKKINKLEGRGGTDVYGSIYSTARYLRENAPNRRRAIILVSDNCHEPRGGGNSRRARTEMLEAGATLYSIRTPGMNYGRGRFSGCSEPNARVQEIAEDTGGELLDVNATTSLQAALKRAISNLRYQYTLGFNPSDPGESGSFHELKVRLASEDRCPGCGLLARKGYYSGISAAAPQPGKVRPVPSDSVTRTDQLLIQRIVLTAGTTDLDLQDIPFTVETAEQTDSSGQRQIKLDFHIDAAAIEFRKVENLRRCNLDLAVFCADKKGEILDIQWKKLEGPISEESHNRILKEGASVSLAVTVSAKTKILRIVIFDEDGNSIGGKLLSLQ